MIDPDMKTIGIKQMHPMQIEALMDFIGWAVDLSVLSMDENLVQETEASADELVRMFGGKGVRIEVED